MAKSINQEKAITTFEEYEEKFNEFDYIILIVAPSIIIGIGTIYYFKRTKRL